MYLNVIEVESALSLALLPPFTAFTQLLELPNLTWNGRLCHAIKIGNQSVEPRKGVFFLGGVHAREWGSSDILINLVEQIADAYSNKASLNFGSKTFSPGDIQAIVNSLDVIVFPQANPDGRNYSMTGDALWRKNLRTEAPNSAACAGVDINRNYDFLWNYPEYFDPNAGVVNSKDPCNYEIYIGDAAFSEPETQNVKWIFDSFPNIGFFVDLHSWGNKIMYTWGDDPDQSTDPNMNFQNPAFNASRGDGAYKEYIPANDLQTAQSLATAMNDAIEAYRGTSYRIEQLYDLYRTAGSSADYAYSRHFVNPAQANIISYGLEWGFEFQPDYGEMAEIIQEVTSGLLALCLEVADPCWRQRHQTEELISKIEDLEETKRELPPPARAVIDAQIGELRVELFFAEQQLRDCRQLHA
jgi:murein tripeptide amidase MpaA